MSATAGAIERTESEPTHDFTYEGAGCEDADAFRRAVRAKTKAFSLVIGPSTSPVRVQLEAHETGTRAELSIRLEDGRVVTRSIEAQGCREALEAIAFVTAIALDPAVMAPLGARVDEDGSPASPRGPVVAPPSPGSGASPEPERHVVEVETTVGAFGRAAFGPAPNPLLGGGLAVDFLVERRTTLSPSLRLGVSFTTSPAFDGEVGSATFEQVTVSVDLCPARARLGAVSVRPCFETTAGAFMARGSEVDEPLESTRPWWDLGASLLVDIDLGKHLGWSLRGTLAAPLIRDSFELGGSTIHEVGTVVGTGETGVFVRLP